MLTPITLLKSICAIYPATGQEKETEAQREKPQCNQGHSIARTAARGSRFRNQLCSPDTTVTHKFVHYSALQGGDGGLGFEVVSENPDHPPRLSCQWTNSGS